MWDMLLNAIKLFFRGRLFRNPEVVLRMWLLGFTASLLLFGLLHAGGAPLWLTVGLTAFAGGLLQPYLFRNVKYD